MFPAARGEGRREIPLGNRREKKKKMESNVFRGKKGKGGEEGNICQGETRNEKKGGERRRERREAFWEMTAAADPKAEIEIAEVKLSFILPGACAGERGEESPSSSKSSYSGGAKGQKDDKFGRI